MPKIYVKREYTKAGMIQSVSLKPKKGFHLHSAFYNDKGQEVKEGILFSADGKDFCSLAQSLGYTGHVDYYGNQVRFYQLQDCLDYINNHSSSTGGWHMYNYQEDCLMGILNMILKGLRFRRGYQTQYTEILGLKIGRHGENEFSFHTLSKKTGKHVDTGKVIGKDIPIHAWLLNSTKFLNDVTEDYDLRDLFVSEDKSKLMFEKLYGDQVTMDFVSTGDGGNVAKLFLGRFYAAGNGVNGNNCYRVQLEDGSWKYNTHNLFARSLGGYTDALSVPNQKWNYLNSDETNTFNVSNSIKPTIEGYGVIIHSLEAGYLDFSCLGENTNLKKFTIMKYI